jgi:hypothetical protein
MVSLWILAIPLKKLSDPAPQFLHLENGDDKNTHKIVPHYGFREKEVDTKH